MKAYLVTTGFAFGLLTLVHVWRLLVEGTAMLRDPFWVLVTLLSASLCAWACRLIWLGERGNTR